jgi:hypothetical protein
MACVIHRDVPGATAIRHHGSPFACIDLFDGLFLTLAPNISTQMHGITGFEESASSDSRPAMVGSDDFFHDLGGAAEMDWT